MVISQNPAISNNTGNTGAIIGSANLSEDGDGDGGGDEMALSTNPSLAPFPSGV